MVCISCLVSHVAFMTQSAVVSVRIFNTILCCVRVVTCVATSAVCVDFLNFKTHTGCWLLCSALLDMQLEGVSC